MATITTPPVPPMAAAAPAPRRDGPGEWRAGWRVALRLARRDVGRHVGRSLLIVVMVAVPVLLLVGGNIIFSSQDLTSAERIPYVMGQTQAQATYSGGPIVPAQVDQWSGYFGSMGPTREATATPIPGWGADLAAHAKALGGLVGGTAIPITDSAGFTTIGRKQIDLKVRGIDAATFSAQSQGIVRLLSGHWPTVKTEVVVTNVGVYHGLPSSGSVAVSDQSGTVTTYTIVGVGEGWSATYNLAAVDLITLPAADSQETGIAAYLIDRPTPVTWDEVKRLATYGLQVTSRQVILNPPSREELALPDGVQSMADQAMFGQAIASAIMAIGLLLETTLLVGPAFAVSAARQRRTLALAASNGATTAQLRRTVLAQALVLGALAALVGAVVGVIGAWAVIAWSTANRPDTVFGPFDVPVLPVSIIVGCAIISAVIAAMIPARGLGRLDIVGVMRGQNVSPRALVRTPIAGIVLAALGAVGVFWAVAYTAQEPSWIDQVVPLVAMVGAILLVAGTLLMVPMVLVLAAQVARPAPVAVRMAMRDAARQRGRATSTVAAILGGTALLSAILVVAASDSAYREKSYVPQLPMGQARLIPTTQMTGSPVDARWSQNLADIAHGIDPALQVRTHAVIDVTGSSNAVQKPNGPSDTTTVPFFVALRVGCTPAQAIDLGAPKGPDSPPDSSCLSLRGMGMGDVRSGILVGSLADLVQTYGLDATAEATLRAGGIVVAGDKGSSPTWTKFPDGGWGASGPMFGQVDIVGGRVSFARGTANYGADAGPTLSDVTTLSLAATPVPAATLNAANAGVAGPMFGGIQPVGALMTTETAQSLALPVTTIEAMIVDPRGPLSDADEAALNTAVADNNLGWFYVERGFKPYDTVLAVIVLSFIGLIILVATLVSTALSTAETQSMMGTFAAVGATRTTRRNLAAAQAGSLGVIGALMGTLVGFVPGIALARSFTRYPTTSANYGEYTEGAPALVDPTVVIPWLQLAVPILVVPALAAMLAWLAIRKAPTVTRRLT